MLEVDAKLVARRKGILLISDKGFASKAFEKDLTELGVELLRPGFKREKQRFAEPMLPDRRIRHPVTHRVRPLITSDLLV